MNDPERQNLLTRLGNNRVLTVAIICAAGSCAAIFGDPLAVLIVCITVYNIIALRTGPDLYREIETLDKLRKKGIINEQEFEARKTKLLNS